MIRLILFLFFTITLLGKERPTVCLNMIVKNEKEVITRCLESVLPIIDTWVIVDTGSTDGTQAVIRNYLKNISGELHERPWVNFGHNRQEALLLAKNKADYILFMDADDVLSFSKDFQLPPLTAPFYAILTKAGPKEFWFQRLVRTDLDWFWSGAIHEDLCCTQKLEGLYLEGVTYVYNHDGARSKDPNRIQKDIQLLQKEIERDPQNPRNYYYLGNTYVQLKDFKLALAAYEKRAQMKDQGHAEEHFHAMLMIGQLQDSLHYPPDVVKKSLFAAYKSRPYRIEPLYYLSKKLFEGKEYEKAYQVASIALDLPRDSGDVLLSDTWIAEFGMPLQFIQCAEKTAHDIEGLKACEQLLKQPHIPEDVKKETTRLLDSFYQKTANRVEQKLNSLLPELAD